MMSSAVSDPSAPMLCPGPAISLSPHPHEPTDSTASALVVLPQALEITQSYDPASALRRLLIASRAHAAEGFTVVSIGTPPLRHW